MQQTLLTVQNLGSSKELRVKHVDYIVIGSGSAGCVVANRLSEDPATQVLVLEAGGTGRSIFIRMPAAMHFAMTRFAWPFESGPEPSLNNRVVPQPRGRALGGSSAINGMVFNRGNPLDFNNWAQGGLPEWSWAHCLPYFRKLETYDGGESPWRGGSGPMHVTTCAAADPFYQNFLEAGYQAGYQISADQNGFQQEGMHVAQGNTFRGQRWTAADAYLWPAARRPNLYTKTDAYACCIVIEKRRAIGVEVSERGVKRTYRCHKEIILCAGAIGSPQLLMLSGVGDSGHLKDVGIKPVHHLPGVGQNLEDHPAATVQYQSTSRYSLARKLSLVGQIGVGLEWLLRKRGLGASIFFEVGGFIRTRPEHRWPNLQFEFAPVIWNHKRIASSRRLTVADGFQYFYYAMRPTSRGRVSLRSANPFEKPSIVSNFLSTREDQQDMIDGLRRTRHLVSQSAWSEARGTELAPGPDVQSDVEILRWLRATAGTEYHPACTCRMGIDGGAVVDGGGRVNGLDGLRVIDASIMPRMITANPNAAVIMIAEKLADLVRQRSPLAPNDPGFYRV